MEKRGKEEIRIVNRMLNYYRKKLNEKEQLCLCLLNSYEFGILFVLNFNMELNETK